MHSTTRRVGVVALAVAALVAAFAVLRPGDPRDAPRRADDTTMPTRASTAGGAVQQGSPNDRGPLLLAGQMRTIEVRKGQHVRFRVRSARPEELHVHGYDLLRTLPVGRTVNVSFAADIEGIFEIELERSATEIAKLEVQP